MAAWLHGVAVRVCKKALARRAKKRVPPFAPELPADPADAVSWADARRAIDAALAELPDSLRLPLVLCYLRGLTRDEAAEQLGWPPATLRGRLERGRDKLRVALERRGFPLSVGLVTVLLTPPVVSANVVNVVPMAVGQVPVSESVRTLSSGVVTPMKRWWMAAVVCGGLTIGLVAATADDKPRPALPNVPPPAKVLAPDPKAPKTPAEFAGTWQAEQRSPADPGYWVQTIRFLDGTNIVWHVRVRSPGVDTSVTLRGTYRFDKGDFHVVVTDKYVGEEMMAVRPNEVNRDLLFAWADEAKTAFKVRSKDDPDGTAEWREFRKVKDEPPTPAEIPERLKGIDRTIKKEPKYDEKPVYLLLAFGPEAKFKVWAVLDGTTLYVDRNGNGDLTDDGEKFTGGGKATGEPGGPMRDRSFAYAVGDLTDGTTKHTDMMVSGILLRTGTYFSRCGVKVDGVTTQLAGPTNLRLTGSPADAQVVHFGAKDVTVRPSISLPGFPDAAAPADFRVQVGTPGVGSGSFASFMCENLPGGIHPTAEFEFPSLNPNEAPKKIVLALTERCCGDHYFANVRVPDGVKTGVDAAKVTLTFPNCPWGEVKPATYTVDVMPKGK